VKYGMMTDDKFLEKAEKFHVMQDATDNHFYTLEEYKASTSALQKNKEGKQVILYATDNVQQDAFIKGATNKGYKVVKLETIVDAAFINQMEMKWSDVHFVRVDADIAENLIDKQESSDSVLNKEQEEQLRKLFEQQPAGLHLTVEVKGLSPEAAPVVATRPEFMRRMKDMAAVSGPMGSFYANMPDEVTLTINGNHSIYQQILSQNDSGTQEKLVRNLADLALLSQGLLKGAALTTFIERSVDLMAKKEVAGTAV
jgi:molecular chaperone HtpG